MQWFSDLLANSNSAAYTALVYALVICSGTALGRLRFLGISLGVTVVLFTGILVSFFGLTVNAHISHFIKEFGLILFVYSIGLQVGPGFFASFQREGLRLNSLVLLVVALDIVIVLAFLALTETPLPELIGIMQGAVTNTPGLGAAQQTLGAMTQEAAQTVEMAAAYAAAYPGGIMGLIAALFFFKFAFGINVDAEKRLTLRRQRAGMSSVTGAALKVENPLLEGKTLAQLYKTLNMPFTVSRIHQNGIAVLADEDMVLHHGDTLLIIARDNCFEQLTALIGSRTSRSVFNETSHATVPERITTMRINVTQNAVCNRKLSSLNIHGRYGVNITRVRRAGMEFIADHNTRLQFGDSITVVGDEAHIKSCVPVFGNSKRELDIPHIAELFLGIMLGVLLGSIPVSLPGIPAPVKLGLAGGPLIVAILISRYGGRLSVTHYVSQSANLMVRELGLALFLASVGLDVGPAFFAALLDGDGLYWMALGIVITVLPLLIVGTVARGFGKLTYPEICGMLTGSHTGAPVLPFACEISQSEQTAIKYAAVYPLATFLRIMVGQTLIVLFMAT